MKNFQDLLVWHKSHALTLQSYQNTGDFPRHELFGLTSQIRRCTASIPANIAEACGRRAAGEFDRFLQIAAGSASELQYHFLLARDLGYMSATAFRALDEQVQEVKRMLASLIRKVHSERQPS